MRQLAKQVWYWRMAVIRCVTLMTVTWFGVFATLTESYSSAQWTELGDFLKYRIYMSCFSAAGGVLIAFLDATMGELKKKVEDSTKQITTVTTATERTEPTPPPILKTD